MTRKAERQAKVLQIVENHVVKTQEELSDLLREEGIEVTQATISRDIKEIQLVKVPSGDGEYRYARKDNPSPVPYPGRMLKLFRDCVQSVDSSPPLITVQTLPATASAVAEAIDGLEWPEVIGTISGERTVFVLIKPASAVDKMVSRFRSLG